MIRVLQIEPNRPPHPFEIEDFTPLLKATDQFFWVDIYAEPDDRAGQVLGQFALHPIVIDDILHETHIPKVNDWGSYLHIVLLVRLTEGERLMQGENPAELEMDEIDILLGANYLLTHHNHPLPAVERLWQQCQHDPRLYEMGRAYLLYLLADEIAEDFLPLVDALMVTLEDLEDAVFNNPQRETLEGIFRAKRMVTHLYRMVEPQRSALSKLEHGDFMVMDPKQGVLFRDVHDHFLRLQGYLVSMRELVSSAMDTYLSVVNNRLSDVVKTLTVFTALFMPVTFITSFFGMNFFYPEFPVHEWMARPVFFVVLGLVLLLPASLLVWTRRKGWL
jgi:magnesium transporter